MVFLAPSVVVVFVVVVFTLPPVVVLFVVVAVVFLPPEVAVAFAAVEFVADVELLPGWLEELVALVTVPFELCCEVELVAAVVV